MLMGVRMPVTMGVAVLMRMTFFMRMVMSILLVVFMLMYMRMEDPYAYDCHPNQTEAIQWIILKRSYMLTTTTFRYG